jgi:hypothetical protein
MSIAREFFASTVLVAHDDEAEGLFEGGQRFGHARENRE